MSHNARENKLTEDLSIYIPPTSRCMQANHVRSAFALEQACYKLMGIDDDASPSESFDRIAVMTLTFSTPLLNKELAKRHLDIIIKFLKRRYGQDLKYVWVHERHAEGGIHFHVLLEMPFDVRTGTRVDVLLDWNNYRENPVFRDRVKDCLPFLNETLRTELVELGKLLPHYGIGRFDLLPILSDADRLTSYLGKSIVRHLMYRLPEDKGARLWGCSKNVRVATTRFSFVNQRTKEFRTKLAVWALERRCHSLDEVRHIYGRHWFFAHRDEILGIPLP